jgi:hypothetical protein
MFETMRAKKPGGVTACGRAGVSSTGRGVETGAETRTGAGPRLPKLAVLEAVIPTAVWSGEDRFSGFKAGNQRRLTGFENNPVIAACWHNFSRINSAVRMSPGHGLWADTKALRYQRYRESD